MEDFVVKTKTNKRPTKSTAKTKSKQLELPLPQEINNNNNANNINNNNLKEITSLPPLPKKLHPLPNLPGQSFPLGFRNTHNSRNRDHHEILWDFVLSLDQNPLANLILKSTLCDACRGRVEPNDTRAILPCGHTYHASCIENETDPQCSACAAPKIPIKQKEKVKDVQMEELMDFVDDMEEELMIPELPELPELPEPLPTMETDSKKKTNKKRKKKTTKTRKSKRAKSKNTKK